MLNEFQKLTLTMQCDSFIKRGYEAIICPKLLTKGEIQVIISNNTDSWRFSDPDPYVIIGQLAQLYTTFMRRQTEVQ